jgi:mutual gliding-motility protein MglA
MVLFNYGTRELTAKVVYYGPGLCGKTTNLQFIYDSLPSTNKSKMLSLATQTDRTLFFDFLPLDLGRIRGMRTRLQLYTVPGQVFYNSTRQLVLKGADGVVFVADSQDAALDANLESLSNLEDNLRKQGIRIEQIPLIIQYNKRDLPNALPVADLEAALNRLKVRSFESVATTGQGVEAALNAIAQLVLSHLARRYGLEGSEEIGPDLHVLSPPAETEQREQESVWLDDGTSDDAGPAEAPVLEALPPAEEPELAFEQLIERFESGPAAAAASRHIASPAAQPSPAASAVAVADLSVELPDPPRAEGSPQPPASPWAEAPPPQELVKDVTIPLNLTLEELQRYRKMKLKITLEVNLLK